MIYELALAAKGDASESDVESLGKMVKDTLKEYGGEVLIDDSWGLRTLAQPTTEGDTKAHYHYFLYKVEGEANNELLRKFKINEKVLKNLIVYLGEDKDQERLVKAYKTPYSKSSPGSVTDSDDEDANPARDRRKFARRKTCWFTAKDLQADWKDPNTYAWLVNEFGKISPARITGVSRKHQRFVTSAIKRARQMGMVSHISNRTLD